MCVCVPHQRWIGVRARQQGWTLLRWCVSEKLVNGRRRRHHRRRHIVIWKRKKLWRAVKLFEKHLHADFANIVFTHYMDKIAHSLCVCARAGRIFFEPFVEEAINKMRRTPIANCGGVRRGRACVCVCVLKICSNSRENIHHGARMHFSRDYYYCVESCWCGGGGGSTYVYAMCVRGTRHIYLYIDVWVFRWRNIFGCAIRRIAAILLFVYLTISIRMYVYLHALCRATPTFWYIHVYDV